MTAPEIDRLRDTLASPSAVSADVAVARLEAGQRALEATDDPALLAQVARALPRRVRVLEPEVAMAVARLAQSLVAHGPRIPDDERDLEPSLRVRWLRVQLAAGDVACLASLDERTLLHVAHEWPFAELTPPIALLDHLRAAQEPRLRAIAVRWLPKMVAVLALPVREAFEQLEALARDTDSGVRAAALDLLPAAWLRAVSPEADRRRLAAITEALANDVAEVRSAAIRAAAALDAREPLAAVLEDERSLPRVRAEILDALGRLATDTDLATALHLAHTDPLLAGAAARRFLLDAHRHGVFLREHHLEAALLLHDVHAAFTAEEVVRVTHIARGRLVEILQETSPDDPRWVRRAAILAASVGTGAHLVLADLLARATDVSVVTALVRAAGRSPEFTGEDLLVRRLDDAPEAVLESLRVKGSPAVVTKLEPLVFDPATPSAIRALAIDVMWAWSEDRTALARRLAERLGPVESGLLDGRRLRTRDGRVAEVAAGLDPARIEELAPFRQLELFCEAGDERFLSDVTRLFREVFRSYVGRALGGDFSIKRLQMPELEQLVCRYGHHLVKSGRPVRRWIEETKESGTDLLLLLVVDWLREAPSQAVTVALLESLARHPPYGAYLRFVETFWRRGDAHVKRAAIEAILATGEGARGLELSLARLADAADPRVLVQALAATRTLRAGWAEPIVRAALDRPEMGVKKEAAEALAEIGNGASISALVHWLSIHDNASFRGSLHKALARAAGPALTAVLVTALKDHAPAHPRTRDLLGDALSGHLKLAAAVRLARSPHPEHQALATACLDGRIALRDGTADDLARALHRAALRPAPRDPTDPVQALRLEGFSPAAAITLARRFGTSSGADEEPRRAALAVVGAVLPSWVSWLGDSPEIHREALALALDAATPAHAPQVPRLFDLLERAPDLAGLGGAIVGFVDRVVACTSESASLDAGARVRAIRVLRRLAPRPSNGGLGLRRYHLLRRLNAVPVRADLEACLDACRFEPNVQEQSTRLLCDALSIPLPHKDEPAGIAKLRDEAAAWFHLPPQAASAWLTEALRARPLGLPVVPGRPTARRAPSRIRSREDLDGWVDKLTSDDEPERSRAAMRILDCPDARASWRQIADAFAQRRVDLDPIRLRRLAESLDEWPDGDHAGALVPFLSPPQLRRFLPRWLARWDRGDPRIADVLAKVPTDALLPAAFERARRKDFSLARFVHPARSVAPRFGVRAYLELLAVEAPSEIPPPLDATGAPAPGATDPPDPLAGGFDDLVRLVEDKSAPVGLAVRAVHALTKFKERAIGPLDRACLDRRPRIRSAALRALRAVAPPETTLATKLSVLQTETRKDVILQLMAALAHGRYEPALAQLIERATAPDTRIRKGAYEALRAWGRDAIPALRHAARHARPDRRPRFAALLAELEGP